MRKEKTIEVTACDFCINEDVPVLKCANCEREACAKCCHEYAVTRSRPKLFSVTQDLSTFGINFTQPVPDFRAVFCDDCGKNVVSIALLRASFEELPRGPRTLTEAIQPSGTSLHPPRT